MRRSVHVPFSEEVTGADRKAVSAVGIANFENRPGHGLPLSREELEFAVYCLHHRNQRHWSVLHWQFHREPSPETGTPREVNRLVPRMMELIASSFSGFPTPLW